MTTKKLDYNGLCTLVKNIKKLSNKIFSVESDPLAIYRYTMKEFFEDRGSATATPAQLTAICDEWYMESREDWDGYTKFYHPDLSAVSEGVKKGGDNYGMICKPSTNNVRGRDDYSYNPLFIPTDCNWEMTNDGEPLITSIEGINCLIPFERNNPSRYVGVLQMTGYHWWTELSSSSPYYYEGYCSRYTTEHGSYIEALPESVIHPSVNVSGRTLLESVTNGSGCNVRSWVLHSKYMSDLTSNNIMTSYSGSPTRTYVFSHNTSHTYANNTSIDHNQTSTYSGATICDNAFLILMSRIKYGSLTMDGIIQGCSNYAFQYAAVVAETNVKRVIISAANAENIIIGSTMLVGTGTDRASSAYSISGQNGYMVTGKVPVGDNIAIVFNDASSTFNTTTSTYISSFTWRSGSCDNILGNDGSPYNCTSGTDPAKLQGIECMMGSCEVFADVIMNLYQESSKYWIQPYLVRKVSNQAESITSNYVASGIKIEQPSSNSWNYIAYMSYKNGIYFGTRVGGSETTYAKDAIYLLSNSTEAKIFRSYGNFMDLNAICGLYCSAFNTPPDQLAWFFSTRLSCNGNRGVYIHS